ncbi:MAG: DUF421 domain-containing protein [Candidatus Dojkabacteria bacterium]
MTALTLLVLLQFVITFLTVRFQVFNRIIKSEPTLLFKENSFYTEAMKRVRVNRAEILQAMRENGFGSIREVGAVVLETTGELSVIGNIDEEKYSSLEGVRFYK